MAVTTVNTFTAAHGCGDLDLHTGAWVMIARRIESYLPPPLKATFSSMSSPQRKEAMHLQIYPKGQGLTVFQLHEAFGELTQRHYLCGFHL